MALVTGVGRQAGIGVAVATRLAVDGWDVATNYWAPYDDRMTWGHPHGDVDLITAQLRDAGARTVAVATDLAGVEGPVEVFDAAEAALGPVTALVLCHCESVDSGLLDTSVDSFDKHYAVNVRASWLLIREFARRFRVGVDSGRIIAQGAVAAGLDGDRQRAERFLDEASRQATRIGGDRNDYWTAFGPTNVEIHRVSAYVALRDWGAALDVADRMNQHLLARLPKERRANHLIDLAEAYALGARTDEAVTMLVQADSLAPKEVRCRPITRSLIHDLWRRSRRAPSSSLQRLVDQVGRPA